MMSTRTRSTKAQLIDAAILLLHIGFIVFSFAVAIYLPFYLGFLMIALHYTHEKVHGDCILSTWQRDYGFARQNEDFFHYLFRRLGFQLNPTFTLRIHHFVKTLVLIIIVIDLVERIV